MSSRADDCSPLELIYAGESDKESDSKKTVRSPGSPVAADYEPLVKNARSNTQTNGHYHSLFDLEDEDA